MGNKHAHGPVMKCDLLDFDAVTKLVTSLRPNVIVHCAAERRLEVRHTVGGDAVADA